VIHRGVRKHNATGCDRKARDDAKERVRIEVSVQQRDENETTVRTVHHLIQLRRHYGKLAVVGSRVTTFGWGGAVSTNGGSRIVVIVRTAGLVEVARS